MNSNGILCSLSLRGKSIVMPSFDAYRQLWTKFLVDRNGWPKRSLILCVPFLCALNRECSLFHIGSTQSSHQSTVTSAVKFSWTHINIGNIAFAVNGAFFYSGFRVFLPFPILFYEMTEISTISFFLSNHSPFFSVFIGLSWRKQSDRWWSRQLVCFCFHENTKSTKWLPLSLRLLFGSVIQIDIAFDERDSL